MYFRSSWLFPVKWVRKRNDRAFSSADLPEPFGPTRTLGLALENRTLPPRFTIKAEVSR